MPDQLPHVTTPIPGAGILGATPFPGLTPAPPPPVLLELVRLGRTRDLASWPPPFPRAELPIPRGDPRLCRALCTNEAPEHQGPQQSHRRALT